MHSEKLSIEELHLQCKANSIPWMIIIKDRTYRTGGFLRVKNVEKKSEVQITRSELADYILQVVKGRQLSPPAEHSPTPTHKEPSATQISVDVIILNQVKLLSFE
jgi:hypothetical protein